MAKLDAATRNALSTKEFAIPSERKFPIENENHARNALARAYTHPEWKAKIQAAVKRKYPDMGKE